MSVIDRLGTDVADTIRRGVSWWLGELTTLVPRRLLATPDKAPATLQVATDEIALILAGRGSAPPTRIPLSGVDVQEDRARIQSAIQRRTNNAVIIRFDKSLLLETRVTLPIAAERSLRSILFNQLERLVPLPANEVEFEYSVAPRSPAAKTIDVRLIVASRDNIERTLEFARSVGLVPSHIIAPIDGTAGGAFVTLWRAGRDAASSNVSRMLRRGLEVAAVVLLLAAYATYVYRLDAIQDDLQQQVAQATQKSAKARDVIRQITQAESELAVLQRRQREMDPLMLLGELTKLVPDTMWVSQLTVRGRNAEIIGYSPRVADLISRLENHTIFYNPRFRAPITLSPDGKGERFDVSFDVRVEDVP